MEAIIPKGRPKKYATIEEAIAVKLAKKREWYANQADKSKQSEYNKQYYAANKEAQKKRARDYYEKTINEPTNSKTIKNYESTILETINDPGIINSHDSTISKSDTINSNKSIHNSSVNMCNNIKVNNNPIKQNKIPQHIFKEIDVISNSNDADKMRLFRTLYNEKIEPLAYDSLKINTCYLVGMLYLYFPSLKYRWSEYILVRSSDVTNNGRYIHISPGYDIYEFIIIVNGNKTIYNIDVFITKTTKNDVEYVKKIIQKSLTLFPRDTLFDLENGQIITSEIFDKIVKKMLNMSYSSLQILYIVTHIGD